MSFILQHKPYQPVFDIPTKEIYKTEFVDRRFATIIGRSVFSEKNQPVQPSKDFKYRKCFVAYEDILYKINKTLQHKSNITPNIINVSIKDSSYSISLNYFYGLRKLKQTQISFKIESNYSDINSINTNDYKNNFSLYSSKSEPFNYPIGQNLKNNYKYQYDNFKFAFINNEEKNKNNLLLPYNFSFISINKTSDKYYCFQTNTNKNLNKKEYLLNYIFDFSSYIVLFTEKMLLTGLNNKLLPYLENTKLTNTNTLNNNYYNLSLNSKDFKVFNYKLKKSIEKLFVNEIFAKFYITAKNEITINDIENHIRNIDYYSTDLPIYISDKTLDNIPYLNINENGSKYYEKEINTLKVLTNSLTNKITFKTESLNHFCKPILNKILNKNSNIFSSFNTKYKRARLALRLKILRPKFINKNINLLLNHNKSIKNNIYNKKTNKILANFQRINFNHNSPQNFSYTLDNQCLLIKTNYKLRKSSFFNKSPLHAKYLYKLLHQILESKCTNSQFFIDFNRPILKSQNAISNKLDYTYKFILLPKISYKEKQSQNKININRTTINNIIFSSKNKILNNSFKSSLLMTKNKRIGLNRLKSLKIINEENLINKPEIETTFLYPYKRITPLKQNLKIKRNIFSLIVIKSLDELYCRQENQKDKFNILYKTKDYDFCKYLPSQITESFILKLNIITINKISTLSQKEIIPPPGWKKIKQKFICKLRLGPYPFGFPGFSITKPHFYVLTTRDTYSIKDITIDNIYKESFFILSKDKLFLPELSMKKPKRFIYSEITPNNSPKEFYTSKHEKLPSNIYRPKRITSFNYTWLRTETFNSLHNSQSIFTGYLNLRLKKYSFVINSSTYNLYKISDKFLFKSLSSTMPKIDKLSLKTNVYVTRKDIGKIILNGYISKYLNKFINSKITQKNQIFVNKNIICFIKRQKTWTLPQFFPFAYEAKNTSTKYMARFRSFRFPYIPEYNISINKTFQFLKDKDYSDYYSCKFQEDFRMSQFEFGLTELNVNFSNYNNPNCIYSNLQPTLFPIQNISFNKLENIYILLEESKPRFINSSLPENLQHLISPKFFKIKENLNYKFKRRDQKQNTFKYLQNIKIINENYFFINSKIQSIMESPSFHWIILLRKNNINAKELLFTTNKAIKTRLFSFNTNDYKFSNKESFLYKALIKPTIYSISRSKLVYNARKEKLLANNTILNYNNLFKNRYINKYTVNIITKPYTKLTYEYHEYPKINIKIEDLYKGLIIEPQKNINKPQKGNITFSSNKGNLLKSTFEYQKNKLPKITNYRPIYIPDFIDINHKDNRLEVTE